MTLRRICCAALLAGVVVVAVPVRASASQDRYTNRQWGLRRVDAERAWSAGRGDGATIAVVDTGVDLKHPDLKGSFVPGRDFVDDDNNPMDENGHGTHVAGIAAARADNGIGVAGVAPRAKIMPIRVLNDDGGGRGSDIAAGVRWAIARGADVINLSLTDDLQVVETLTCGSMSDLAEEALAADVVMVVAAGNGGLFRCDDASAMVVTSTTTDDTKPGYASSVGSAEWGLAAPGGDDRDDEASMIFSTLWDAGGGSGYGWAHGTSAATPHVAGAAAVLRGLGLGARAAIDRILATAEDIGSAGDDGTFGHGLLDVAAAVKGLGPRPVVPPARTPEPDDEPAPASSDARPAAAGAPASPRAEATVELASPRPTARSDAPKRERAVASDELSEGSAVANLVLGGTLLAAAGGLVGYGSLRRFRSRSD